MTITHIDIFRYSIKMTPFRISTGVMDYAQNVLIRIHTAEQHYGLGECSAFPVIVGETQDSCLLLAKSFAALWKGKDPLAIADRLAELDDYIAGNHTVKSAFDMALYDLASKSEGLPLYAFLGGKKRPISTDITIGIGTPDEMANQAARFVEQGARYLKVKLGKIPADDIARIKAIRRKIGSDTPIRIDANQGWDVQAASVVLNAIKNDNIEFCEQPLRVHNDFRMGELKEFGISLMADESCYVATDAEQVAREGHFDYINIKLAKSGGIHEALKICKVADAHQIPCMLGGMLESRLALSAMVHLAYARDVIKFFDLDTCLVGHLEDPVEHGLQYEGFDISIADIPGIGAGISESSLTSYEKTTI